jgi:hypothetical protein
VSKQQQIGLKRAMDLMHKGARLLQMHDRNGSAHFVVPGARVHPDVAEKIKQNPLVTAGKDGLWPGLDQTWPIK